MHQMHDLNVTIITHSFPSEYFPVSGVFVQDHADYLSPYMQVRVLAPKPRTNYFLSIIKEKWGFYQKIPKLSSRNNYNIIRPEYITYPKNYFYWRIGENFWKAIKDYIRNDVDIYHVHFLFPAGSVIPKIREKLPNKTIYLSIHGNDWHLSKNDRRLQKSIYNTFIAVNKILTVSRSLSEDIIRTFPEFSHKISVMHNGVDKNRLMNINPSDTFESKDKIKILMVGGFVHGKGVHILLQAIRSLDSVICEVVIIGNMIDKKSFQELLKLRNELNLNKQVKFLVSQPREKVYQYMRDCDYFILPSLKEGFGIALVEALVFGKPVISTYSGGPEEIVTKHNGILIEPGNIDALKKAIEKMNSSFMNYSPEELSEDIEKRFGIQNLTQNLLNEYTKSLQ